MNERASPIPYADLIRSNGLFTVLIGASQGQGKGKQPPMPWCRHWALTPASGHTEAGPEARSQIAQGETALAGRGCRRCADACEEVDVASIEEFSAPGV